MSSYNMEDSLKHIYDMWMGKTKEYECQENRVRDYYDKFFSLYVVYNILYTELAYKVLNRKNFRDDVAATKYAKEYLKAKNFIDGINKNYDCKKSLDTIVDLLSENQGQGVHIILNPLDGKPVEGKDKKLLEDLTGQSSDHKSGAILALIYNIRCNMFHGRKEFSKNQTILLESVMILLEQVIKMLYDKMSNEGLQQS